MLKHTNIKVTGFVQGVFFRDFVKNKADTFGLHGFARNEPDGTLYIEAEGEEKSLDGLVEACYFGPLGSEVKKVEVTPGPLEGYKQFSIEY